MKILKHNVLCASMVLCAALFFSCANNPKRISDEIMEDIFNGEFGYLPVVGGRVLSDIKFRTTDILFENWVVQVEGKLYDVKVDRFKYQPMFFDLPNNIKSFKYLGSWDNPDQKIYKTKGVSQEYYKEYDYLKHFYKGYEDYKQKSLKECESNPDCKYYEEDEYILYKQVVPEKRFHYRVETITSIDKATICMYRINNEWKVGAILKKNI